MTPCPVCRTPHLLKTSPVTGEPLLGECVKALRAELEQLRGASPSAEGTSGAIGSLNDRLTAVESLISQKVCFSTFDPLVELVNGLALRVAGVERALAQPTTATEPSAGAVTYVVPTPEPIRSVQVGDGPVTPVEPSGD